MKKPSTSTLIALLAFGFAGAQAQSTRSTVLASRPRTVAGVKTQTTARYQEPSTPSPRPAETRSEKSSPPKQDEEPGSNRRLSPNKLRQRINEAERLMKSRPLQTSMSGPSAAYVTIAAMSAENSQIHLIRLAKQTFLTKGSELSLTTSQGLPVTLRILRANGVNTAVTIFDERNRSMVPLAVEFPIEKRSVFREMAYYTSAHPALLSPDLTRAGQTYVNSMVDLAAKRLRDKGVPVASNIVEVAKRLCIVEHVDHDRFRNDNRTALFEEIYSLYALNELDTYRYSVSSAGAGGMVQMIPWTYALMRSRHPGVGLNPDFVAGLRNHGNALEAMLLYMQDTWNDLAASEDVRGALSEKQATVTELLAAGYNSNAAKLPGYIRRGGSGWRTLIPRETQIYLQIYQSFESMSRSKENHARSKK